MPNGERRLPLPTFGWFGQKETEEWKQYQAKGGTLSFNAWSAAGKPQPSGRLTTYAKQALTKAGITPTMSLEEQQQTAQDYIAAQKALQTLATKEEEEKKAGIPLPAGSPPTWTDERGTIWNWDSSQGKYVESGFDPTKVYQPPTPTPPAETALQKAQRFQTEAETARLGQPTTYPPYGTSPYDIPTTTGVEGQWNPYTGQWEPPAGYTPPSPAPPVFKPYGESPPGWVFNPNTGKTEPPPGYISPYEQQQLDLQRQQLTWQQQQSQMQQAEQQRQMVAQLGANPRSWLEYASYTGQTPTVQPWMLPLMPQQYGLKTGEAIPGYSAQGMAGMPEMTQPSAQLWSRMGPTAQQQMIGYGTARTGQTPEEQSWRMWSQTPPGGQAGGLQWQR